MGWEGLRKGLLFEKTYRRYIHYSYVHLNDLFDVSMKQRCIYQKDIWCYVSNIMVSKRSLFFTCFKWFRRFISSLYVIWPMIFIAVPGNGINKKWSIFTSLFCEYNHQFPIYLCTLERVYTRYLVYLNCYLLLNWKVLYEASLCLDVERMFWVAVIFSSIVWRAIVQFLNVTVKFRL